jgi:hypothetical protein
MISKNILDFQITTVTSLSYSMKDQKVKSIAGPNNYVVAVLSSPSLSKSLFLSSIKS